MKKSILLFVIAFCLTLQVSIASPLSTEIKFSLREFAHSRISNPVPNGMGYRTFVDQTRSLKTRYPNSPLGTYATFALAYKNIDYNHNVDDLANLATKKNSSVYLFKGYSGTEDDLSVGDVAIFFQRLYLNRPNKSILVHLLKWTSDGASQETLNDVRYDLLTKYPTETLNTAMALSNGSSSLVETLDYYYPGKEYETMKKKIRSYVSSNQGQRARFARRLLKDIEQKHNKLTVGKKK